MGSARFAACRAIVDAFADEPIEAIDRESTPCDAGRENERPRPDDIAAIEVDLTRARIDASDGPRDQNLRPSRFACCNARLASSSPETPLGNPR